ncbi:hypothetical protein NDU88_005254 [Pleurodeles waltl]|uniref:Uncharacterized protein n=1 Tax=Pleurodeles waltl TaxID=8319 RepID=A0AAV7UHL9_PLEWA|nr:hypothetical protein NDU88_005254 [Pleurodeles waltl]
MDTKTSLEACIDTVSLDVKLLQADLRKVSDRVEEVVSTLNMVRPTVQDLQEQLNHMEEEVATLHHKGDGLTKFSEDSRVELFLEE